MAISELTGVRHAVPGAGGIRVGIKNLPQIKAAFRKSPALMTQELNIAIKKSIFLIHGRSVTNAPVRTSRLRGSVYDNFGFLKGEIGFKADYAAAVHDGSKAHVIKPKFKRALFWKGAENPVMSVMHPGTKANPFLKKAVNTSEREINQNFETAVQNVLDKVAREIG